MPVSPANACRICRRVNCPGHAPVNRRRSLTYQEKQRRKRTVIAWVQANGYVCPGYEISPHHSTDLTADHLVPLARGGSEHGPLRVLCRGCNARRGASV